MPVITIAGTPIRFAADRRDTVLQAALRAGVAWPYECSVGACGTCRFTVEAGSVDVLRDDAPGLSAMDRRKNRLLACQCVASHDLCVGVKIGLEGRAVEIAPTRVEAVFEASRPVTHDITEYRFRSERAARFLPGQYALLRLPGMASARAYSMSNTANGRGEWTFLIRRVANGLGTAALGELKPGARIELDAPYGGACLREAAARDIVCIAGGSGLAPMLSIARAVASDEARFGSQRLHFYYGARTPADACGLAQLAALPGFGTRLRCVEAVSSLPDDPAAPAWRGQTGPIHEVVARDLAGAFDAYEFYLSGPPPMIAAALTLLAGERRVPPQQIHFDRFF